MTYTIEQLRNAWLAAAVSEWTRGVRDDDGGIPGNRDVIADYFHACGWQWHVDDYVERADNPWCGIFAGAMGLRLGDHLEPGKCVAVQLLPSVAYHATPSTRRLHSHVEWDDAGVPRPTVYEAASVSGERYLDARRGISRLVEDVLLPGVIATVCTRVYGDGRDEYGGHVVIVDHLGADGVVHTVEGNGRGLRGDGTLGEGVVRAERSLTDVRRVYHLTTDHFDMESPDVP